MTINKNIYPYYDDFTDEKKFYQILFNPTRAVQARELSQIQSLIQSQIQKFGNHVFKEGSMVLPGEAALDTLYPYVKLQSQFSGVPINVINFAGKRVVGVTSGTIATVIQGVASENSDPNTLYVKYETGVSSVPFTGSISNNSNQINNLSIAATDLLKIGNKVTGVGIPANTYIVSITSDTQVILNNPATTTNSSASLTITSSDTFIAGETIVTLEASQALQNYSALAAVSAPTGYGSKAHIKEGVYYVSGYFCIVDEQVLILDKYSSTPSYKIGLRTIETFVTSENDAILNDPANGSTNFNAPGADRYMIELVLSKYDFDEVIPDNFIELIRTNEGIIEKLVTRPEYSELEKTLARRTYDQSGDYTVKAFKVEVREHLNDGTNSGIYTESNGGDESKLALLIEPGKAYVRGYEIETQATTIIPIDKSRDFLSSVNYTSSFNLGNYIDVDHVTGSFNVTGMETLNLIDAGSATVGTAKIRSFTLVSGTPGTVGAVYRMHLFDVLMSGSHAFSEVVTISATAKSSKPIVTDGPAALQGAALNAAILYIPQYAIKEFTNEVVYSVKRYLTGTMTGSTLTISAGTNEIFAPSNILNYHVSVITPSATATGNSIGAGQVINMTASGNSVALGGSPSGKQITLTIPTIAGSTIAIVATVIKTLSSPKTKTLTSRTQTLAHGSLIQLDRADVFKIVSITNVVTSADITAQYDLDSGQRDSYYDRGSLVFNTAYPAPSGNVNISYQYFEHGNGDYFSVDSYSGVIPYKDIPFYKASSGSAYDLINCLDFRSRINNSGTGFSVTSEIAYPDSDVITDYDYYTARIDKLILDTFGNFRVLEGSSGINPHAPNDIDNVMVLDEISVPPYTFRTQDVTVKQIDNRRYTMRDIGKLDKRINNLEYYTSLNLLEKSTSDLFIDDGSGNNRFKNGFIVDNFSSHAVGDVTLDDYKCSVSPSEGVLRPMFKSGNIDLDFDSGASSNIMQTGNIVTLPYTVASYINQPFASTTENINPYNIYNWVGFISLTPSSDDWYDTNRLPDQIITNNYVLANSISSINLVGQTIWNDWTTAWIGTSTSVPAPSPYDNVSAVSTFRFDHLSDTNIAGEILSITGRVPTQIVGSTGFVAFGATSIVTSINRDIVSTEVGQSRVGTTYTLQTNTTQEVLGDRIVSVDTVPYIRSRNLSFVAKNLKPNARVYPFFDSIPVSAYCKKDTSGGAYGDSFVTDNSGSVSGIFTIPNDDTAKFRTGTRVFKLIDDANGVDLNASTSAQSLYVASGIINNTQNTIISTQTAEVVATSVNDSRTIITTNIQDTVQQTTVSYTDPLAQTFLVTSEGGVFLNKINIFFSTKDTNNIPVTLSIRNVINGYPGPNIVPFSTVSLTPDQVTISGDASVATSFTFPSPVYLSAGQEYCFVLMANSFQYNIYCSNIGGFDKTTGSRISEQPYAGVMFKSQNASTWTASQEEDIKFEIFRCVFDTSVTGSAMFNNGIVESNLLSNDPITTTSTSNLVKIFHPNHGLTTSNKTVISGVAGAQNGIPAAELNGLHTVTVLDIDNYTFTSTTNATATGSCGGALMKALPNVRIDVGNIITQTLVYPNTALDFSVATTPIGGTLSASYANVATLTNINFAAPVIIPNTNNLATTAFKMKGQMTTTLDNISPVIDLTRSSLICVSNRINNDAANETLAKGGNSLAKYITKKVSLTSAANGVRVYFSALRPANATIQVYVKLRVDSDQATDFDAIPYVLMDAVDYPSFSNSSYRDYTFELMDQEDFSIFAVKIVMLASQTTDVPLIREFRAIATGT